ncbi:EamA family transporter [Mesorhizobium loti]|nr:DMT family transporter [Mesorhizobium loti]PLP61313.1 EamA family transporter [Mesorhizobium loti]
MTDVVLSDTREKLLAGILLTSLAYLLFSLQDASIKLLVTAATVWQILFIRSATILTGCLATGGRQLIVDSARSPILKSMLLRSFLILAAWLCYYTAAKDLQLAELTTIYFAAPIIVTALSIVILGEKVPLLRWAAVLMGFAGVFVACDPASLGFSLPVLLVLAAAGFWGLSIVLLSKVATQERTTVQLVLNNAFFLVIAGVPLLWTWQTPSWPELLLMIAVGALGGLGQYFLFEGMKRAPISVIAPFEYTALLWAFALGFLIWGDVPRDAVFVGAAIIVLAGFVVVASERFRKPAA